MKANTDDKKSVKRGRPYAGGREPLRSIRMSDELWERLREASESSGQSVSAALREMAERYCRRQERRSGTSS